MMTMKQEKRTYAKPAMRTVELHSRGLLMQSRLGVSAGRSAYTHGRTDNLTSTDDEVWE